jgi:transcriptional activator protein UGA3
MMAPKLSRSGVTKLPLFEETVLVAIPASKGICAQSTKFAPSELIQNRKKKCDELKPKCSDCQRLNLLCVRTVSKTTARAQRLFRQAVSTPTHSEPANSNMHTSQAVITSPSSDYKSPAGSLDGVILHDDKFKDQPNAVYQWLATDGSDFSRRDNFDVFDSLILEDSEAPFLQFDAADIPDFLYEKSSHSSPDWFSTEPITIPYNPTLLPLDQLSNRQDQHLLQHYTQIVSRSLCIASTDEDNPFLKYIMPLASTSPAVMGAVLTLSAAHLKHNGGYPETVQRSLKHQTKGKNAGFSDSRFQSLTLFSIGGTERAHRVRLLYY